MAGLASAYVRIAAAPRILNLVIGFSLCWVSPFLAATNKTPMLVEVPIFRVPDFKQM
jgi:hypothetical protein